MNGFTEHRASGASERPDADNVVLTWDAGQAMLPLVGRIAADLVHCHQRLASLQPERARLDRQRHTLAWPERARRYQVQEELVAAEKDLHQALAELDALRVVLLDPAAGLIGFPTLVNNRRAYFSWQPGEERLGFWNFAGDALRRPVPEAWTKPPERPGKGKPRSKK